MPILTRARTSALGGYVTGHGDWIHWVVMQAGGDSSRFSGISARKGGISTAIEARVDEVILYLQSGHCAALPAQAYMSIAFPGRFLKTFEDFGLLRVEG